MRRFYSWFLVYSIGFTFILLVGSSCSRTHQTVKKERYSRNISKKESSAPTKHYTKGNASKSSKTKTVQNNRTKIVRTAKSYIGTPYVYGGKSTKGFDCSGFTSRVYTQNGVQIVGASHDQAIQGKKIRKSEAQPGDLVSFKSKGKVTHVAIITKVKKDELWVAHSTSSKGVINNEIWNSKYWRSKIHEFRDVID